MFNFPLFLLNSISCSTTELPPLSAKALNMLLVGAIIEYLYIFLQFFSAKMNNFELLICSQQIFLRKTNFEFSRIFAIQFFAIIILSNYNIISKLTKKRMPVPSASSKIIFTLFKFFEYVQYFLKTVKFFDHGQKQDFTI